MSSTRRLEIQTGDPTPKKWSVPLTEDSFQAIKSRGNPTLLSIFCDGSLFSPSLFGKYFDPSDAFPLWEFESDVLLAKVRSNNQNLVEWFQTDTHYILKAELPGTGKNSVQIYIEQGKIMEISGQLRGGSESSKTKDWRSCRWWEHGYVRRLEVPENSDWIQTEAYIHDDKAIEILIPKKALDHEG
ncbi:21.7 kDa class VI heat shock protein isoform X2 [Impatiens glandulifera]|uniref:21.7 kDa class VI heat shock protein isoform X2 n=1 Tax=Impatiens glandulifera TaxID=253017 RepID=UPI001FB15443|nr:21.7 kDa class VI heat shock protein isoform X2 [Impatiens glandulifera]